MSIKLIRKNYFEIIPIATFFLFLFYLFLYFIFCFFPFFKKSLDQMAGDTRARATFLAIEKSKTFTGGVL